MKKMIDLATIQITLELETALKITDGSCTIVAIGE